VVVRWIGGIEINENVVVENCHFCFLADSISPKFTYETKIIISEYVVTQWLFIDTETDDLE